MTWFNRLMTFVRLKPIRLQYSGLDAFVLVSQFYDYLKIYRRYGGDWSNTKLLLD